MKSIVVGSHRAPWVIALATSLFVGACARGPGGVSAASVPVAQPLQTDVERVHFDPSLDVHLDNMSRRANGLYVQDLTMGTGAVATTGRTVVVSYTGWLPNGKQFDTGEITVTLGTNKTIRAWEEGLLGMRVGGRRRLVVPPALGYGDNGAGDIPPNSVLVFDMTVESVS